MPTQSQETQTNSGDEKPGDLESSQATTGSAVREGQENSSILHDEEDQNKKLEGPINRDDRAVSQEEFLEDRNTSKKSPDE